MINQPTTGGGAAGRKMSPKTLFSELQTSTGTSSFIFAFDYLSHFNEWGYGYVNVGENASCQYGSFNGQFAILALNLFIPLGRDSSNRPICCISSMSGLDKIEIKFYYLSNGTYKEWVVPAGTKVGLQIGTLEIS